jgi:hypothetical protein
MKKLLLFAFLLGSFKVLKSQSAGTPLSGYTDINPDTLLNYVATPFTNETYSVNMVGDATMDVGFTARGAVSSGGSSAYINITSLNPNVYIAFGRWDSVFVPGSSSWNVTKVAKPLSMGDQLTAGNISWDNSVLYLTDHSGSGGGNKNVNDWIGGDKYIGVKYMNGSAATYGWIRVSCISEDSCYVKDFSAGSVASGIRGNQGNIFYIYPNPVITTLYVYPASGSLNDKIDLRLYDLLGKNIDVPYNVKNNHIEISFENMVQGYYLLQYTIGDTTHSQRIIKSNK